ncbi:MAG: TonB-dependent receptor [Pseudomonadota bacterium]
MHTVKEPNASNALRNLYHMRFMTASSFAFAAINLCGAAAAQAEKAQPISIESTSLSAALVELSQETGVPIFAASELTDGKEIQPFTATLSVSAALDRMLSNTGLAAIDDVNGTIVLSGVQEAAEPSQRPVRREDEEARVRPTDPEPIVEAASDETSPLIKDTVFVTARKREESIQDIPGVINVLSAEQLRSNGTTDARSLALNTLGIVYSETFAGSAAPRITIRGVGDDDFNPNGSSSAAIHVNGVFQGTNGLLNSQYFDIDRVEVLKGPQGTLYGRNATAGTINIITARPEPEYGGYLDIEAGNFGTFRGEGAVNLPINEAFRVRFAALFEESDGFFEHLGTGPVTGFSYAPGLIPAQELVEPVGAFGGADRFSLRLTSELDLTPSTLVTATVSYGEDESELPIPDVTTEVFEDFAGGQAFFIDTNDPFIAAFGAAVDDDPFTVFSETLPQNDNEQFGANLQIDQAFTSDISGVLLVGYESLDRDFNTADALPFNVADFLFRNQFRQLTVEARLSDDNSDGFGWIIGGFFLDDEVEFGTNLIFLNSGLFQSNIETDSLQERSSFGVFASADWTPVEWATLEAGVRFSSDDVTLDGVTRNLDPFGVFGTPPTFFPPGEVFIGSTIDPNDPLTFNEEFDDDEVTWNVATTLRPLDGLNVYGKISTGYKAGGFDGSTILAAEEALPIESETVIAYETGAKYQSPNGLFGGEANLFLYNFDDYQSTALVNVGGVVSNVRTNVADAQIRGAELAANITPFEGLVLNAGLALLDADIEDFVGDDPTIEGNELPFAPTVSWNASIVYARPISERFVLNAQVDVSGTGSHFQTINNNDEVQSFVVPNARVSLAAAEGWEVALWVRNFIDEEFQVGFFPSTGLTPDTFFQGNPRTFGANLRLAF